MRKVPGKKLGYIILPVVISSGMDPKAALDDNPLGHLKFKGPKWIQMMGGFWGF